MRNVPVYFVVGLLFVAMNAGAQTPACESSATASPGLLLVCPAGDGATLASIGSSISVTVRDGSGDPVANVLFSDLWLIDCYDPINEEPSLILCPPQSLSSNADANTDVNGNTTFRGSIAAGGCADNLSVVVQGIVLQDPNFPCTAQNTIPLCLPIETRSPDFNGDLSVDLLDVATFAALFGTATPGCVDLNGDGIVSLVDLSIFAQHFGHTC